MKRTGQSKIAVVGWGRGMGHSGHMYLADAVITQAKDMKADPYFFVSKTVGKDDPIYPEEKVRIYQKVFPQYAPIFTPESNLNQALEQLAQLGYQGVVVVVGADQKQAFQYLEKPNKQGVPVYQSLGLKKLRVISRQETRSQYAKEEGPRATPMREILLDPSATEEEKFKTWRRDMPEQLSDREVLDVMNKAESRLLHMSTPKVDNKVQSMSKKVAKLKESRIMDRNALINAFYVSPEGKKHRVAEKIPYYLLDKLVGLLTKKYNITMNDIEVRPADASQYRRTNQPELAEERYFSGKFEGTQRLAMGRVKSHRGQTGNLILYKHNGTNRMYDDALGHDIELVVKDPSTGRIVLDLYSGPDEQKGWELFNQYNISKTRRKKSQPELAEGVQCTPNEVAELMYNAKPELFTKFGDEFVMNAIEQACEEHQGSAQEVAGKAVEILKQGIQEGLGDTIAKKAKQFGRYMTEPNTPHNAQVRSRAKNIDMIRKKEALKSVFEKDPEAKREFERAGGYEAGIDVMGWQVGWAAARLAKGDTMKQAFQKLYYGGGSSFPFSERAFKLAWVAYNKHHGPEAAIEEGIFDRFKKKAPEPQVADPGNYPRIGSDIAQWMRDTVEFHKAKHPDSVWKLFCPSYPDYLPTRVRVGTSEKTIRAHLGDYVQLRDANPEAKQLARQKFEPNHIYPNGPREDYQRLSEGYGEDDGIHIGAKVYHKEHQSGEPFEVVKILDDQRVGVIDEYGNKKAMFIDKLVPAQQGMDEAYDHNAPFNAADFNRHMEQLRAREELRKTDPVKALVGDLIDKDNAARNVKKKPQDDSSMDINDPRHPGYSYTEIGHHKVDEGDVVQFPKKHRGDISDMHECPKCGGDLQGGKYMGHQVQVCMPCKQVYLPPNSGIDQQGNKIKEAIGRRGILKGLGAAMAAGAAGKASAIAGAFPTPSHQQAMYKAAADSNAAQARADAAEKAKRDAQRLKQGTSDIERLNKINYHGGKVTPTNAEWDGDGDFMYLDGTQYTMASRMPIKGDEPRDIKLISTKEGRQVYIWTRYRMKGDGGHYFYPAPEGSSQINEFAPGNGDDDGLPNAEYEVYQCSLDDQFEWIGEPLMQTDRLDKAHGFAYNLWQKHPDKCFMIWQERSQGSRGGYGPVGSVLAPSEDDVTESSDYIDEK